MKPRHSQDAFGPIGNARSWCGPARASVIATLSRSWSQARGKDLRRRRWRLAKHPTRLDFHCLRRTRLSFSRPVGRELWFHSISRRCDRSSIIVTANFAWQMPESFRRRHDECARRQVHASLRHFGNRQKKRPVSRRSLFRNPSTTRANLKAGVMRRCLITTDRQVRTAYVEASVGSGLRRAFCLGCARFTRRFVISLFAPPTRSAATTRQDLLRRNGASVNRCRNGESWSQPSLY
jgi:hypothetical protein